MRLPSLLRRLRTRPPAGQSVELKPMEQVVLAYLLTRGSASLEEVGAVIEGRRPVLAPAADEVLSALIAQGLVQARIELEREALYVPTSKAGPLKRRIPEDPRTATEFRL